MFNEYLIWRGAFYELAISQIYEFVLKRARTVYDGSTKAAVISLEYGPTNGKTNHNTRQEVYLM